MSPFKVESRPVEARGSLDAMGRSVAGLVDGKSFVLLVVVDMVDGQPDIDLVSNLNDGGQALVVLEKSLTFLRQAPSVVRGEHVMVEAVDGPAEDEGVIEVERAKLKLLPTRAAYEGYAAFTGGKTFDGRDMPTWAELPDRIRGAWAAALAATSIASTRAALEAAAKALEQAADEIPASNDGPIDAKMRAHRAALAARAALGGAW